MQQNVSEYQPTSLPRLKEIIKQAWIQNIDSDYCKCLVHSMPRSMQKVIKKRNTNKILIFYIGLVPKTCSDNVFVHDVFANIVKIYIF